MEWEIFLDGDEIKKCRIFAENLRGLRDRTGQVVRR